jgi:hypothetical protein
MHNFFLIVAALWATTTVADPDILSRQLFSSRGIPPAANLGCAADIPIDVPIPITNLTCNFNLKATGKGLTKSLTLYRYIPHRDDYRGALSFLQSPTDSTAPLVFSLENGAITTSIPEEGSFLLFDSGIDSFETCPHCLREIPRSTFERLPRKTELQMHRQGANTRFAASCCKK